MVRPKSLSRMSNLVLVGLSPKCLGCSNLKKQREKKRIEMSCIPCSSSSASKGGNICNLQCCFSIFCMFVVHVSFVCVVCVSQKILDYNLNFQHFQNFQNSRIQNSSWSQSCPSSMSWNQSCLSSMSLLIKSMLKV